MNIYTFAYFYRQKHTLHGGFFSKPPQLIVFSTIKEEALAMAIKVRGASY
jgi:hypothetical protein